MASAKSQIQDDLQDEVLARIEGCQKEQVVSHLMLAARTLKKFASNRLKAFDIGFEQVGVMHALYMAKELNINQLAKIAYKDRGTISRCVESLCAKKYAVKCKQEKDQRVHVVRLTQSGEDFYYQICQSFEDIMQKPESVVLEKEAKQFHESLDKIISCCKESHEVEK